MRKAAPGQSKWKVNVDMSAEAAMKKIAVIA
jgi:hypothetical protein